MAFNHQTYNDTYLENARAGKDPINDAAQKYGVRIEPAEVAAGETYWKVIGVHHLLPMENWSNHHVYLEVLDENGNRVRNPIAWVGWTWENRRPEEPANPVPIDKPDFEPGGNIAINKEQVVSVWVAGLAANATDKSDRVTGIRTTHPDEPLEDGTLHNTWGHHSFYVVFQKTVKPAEAEHAQSVIHGQLTNGEGRTIQLWRQDTLVAAQTLDATTLFRFENLRAGTYTLKVKGTSVRRTGLQVDGQNSLQVNLAMPAAQESVIHGVVKHGLGHTILLGKGNVVVDRQTIPPNGRFRFKNLPAGVYDVAVWNTNARASNIEVDGKSKRHVTLDASETPPATGKTLSHYVLFGPPKAHGRRLNLFAALDYLLHFSLTAGFSVETAKQAQRVTIIGEGVSAADIQSIRDSGAQVEHLTGDSADIEATLSRRIQEGRSFGG
ncbi:MAG: carboxypeptidase regulatory-like domain-containing protein [Caldilineae bacterium]|nr:MAG: carboxypeptidase regulatory-like domain-containing protein [Caldilineae bacterium]